MAASSPSTHGIVRGALFALLVSMLLAVAGLGAASAGEVKVGVVNFTDALERTEKDGALRTLKRDAEKRQADLKKLEDEIVALEVELQESGPLLSDDKMKEKLMTYQQRAQDYRKTVFVFEQEFAEQKAEVLGKIHRVMQELSVEIAQEKGLDLMIEQNEGAVIYFNNAFNFTEELVTRYQARKAK